MNLLLDATVALMLGLAFLGVQSILDWELECRLAGILTLATDGLGAYLLATQWLPVPENNPYGLIVIALVSGAGYLAGRALASLIRTDWFEDLLDLPPWEISPIRRPPDSARTRRPGNS
ncbi:MAG TPA: hypothetical protein VHE55_14380 [Fimbriimonadaceae bacterium]|nr:hypothetical protein [Fimbriimonadaceae bacterium]